MEFLYTINNFFNSILPEWHQPPPEAIRPLFFGVCLGFIMGYCLPHKDGKEK